jgi:ABC-2 type transport system permease protein
MNKFFELLKVNISLAMMQININRLTKGKKRSFSSGTMLLFVAVLIMVYMSWIANTLYSSIGQYGLGWLLVAMGLLMVSLFTLVTGIYSVNTVLFESQDLDQLFSYPITPMQILFSKLLALVAENWLIGIVFYLPVLAVYCYNVKPDVLFFAYAILGFVCLPFIPVCLFILLAYFLNIITSGKRAKNTINVIITFGLIFGTIFGIQNLLSGYKTSSINPSDLINSFKNFYPPLGYLTNGIVHENLGDLLIGLLWNIVPFVALCIVLSFGYKSLWSRSRVVYKARRGKLSFGVQTQFSTLVQKEFRRYFSSVMYILNSSIGMILMTLFMVLSGTGGAKIQKLELYFPTNIKILFVLLIFGFALVISNTTAPSISLEGKYLWIIKSWPVDEGNILLAKLCVHLTVTIPLLAVNCVIAGLTMHLGIANCIVLFVICALFAVLCGLTGLIFNLYFHRFDFYSDTQVVKNSSSVLLTYLTMAVIVLAFAGVYWLMRTNIVLDWFLAGIGIALAILTAAAAAFVFTKGKEMFKNLV